jgi:hypothetical protein
MSKTVCTALVACLLCAAAACAKPVIYDDPDSIFSVGLPDGWEAVRQDMGDGVTLTTCTGTGTEAQLEVLTFASPRPLTADMLETKGPEIIELVLGLLEQEYTVRADAPVAAKVGQQAALLVDATLTDQASDEKSRFRMYVLLGADHAVAAAVTAPQRDKAGFAAGDAALASLVLAGSSPADTTGPAAPRGGLAAVADRIRDGFRAEPADRVIVEGNPPLTEGSVANFAKLLGLVFGVRLTEAEYALTRERFAEYYGKNDAQGRAIVAQSAGSILESLGKGTKAEQEASLAEVRAVFEDRLSTGAKAGIEWAQVLWGAVERRRDLVTTSTAEAPEFAQGEGQDASLSQADLDAALEMLYFMWVASGRDASAVTPEAVAAIREYLATNFAALPPDLQYLLTNAERVYADMRNAWAQADAGTQQAYAVQFGQALDAMGLTADGGGAGNGGGGGSAWDDVAGQDPSDIRAGLVQTTCFNLAQKSSGGW